MAKKITSAKKRSNLLKRMDVMFSKIIRSVGRCEVCGTKNNLEAHHLIKRAVLHYRYEKMNAICLCNEHHTSGGEMSAHGRGGMKGENMAATHNFLEWLKKYKAEQFDWYDEHRNIRPTGTVYITELYDIEKSLKKELKEIETAQMGRK